MGKKKNPLNVIRTLVKEGRLDDDTAMLLKAIFVQTVNIRDAGRRMAAEYRSILNAIATVRGYLDIVLDNVEDTNNYAETMDND